MKNIRKGVAGDVLGRSQFQNSTYPIHQKKHKCEEQTKARSSIKGTLVELVFEFHALSFPFCVLCYMRWRKKECRETKTGI